MIKKGKKKNLKKESALTVVKTDASSKYMKEVPLANERYKKWYLFCQR